MIRANKTPLFETFFTVYNRNLIRRRFNSLQISGLAEICNLNKNIPLIIYVNHSSWWDGIIAFQISHFAKFNSFIMMDEKQLKRLFLFRKLGAFSVDRGNPHKAIKSIYYAAELLKQEKSPALWIFPQGKILPNDTRPLHFYNGLSHIIKRVGCEIQLLHIAIKYEFTGSFKPEIFIKLGKIETFSATEKVDIKKLTCYLSANLTELLDNLTMDIVNRNFVGFKNLI